MKCKFLRTFTLLYILTCSVSFGSPMGKMTVRAVDEDGKPLGGISVIVGFWNMDSTITETKGVTDTNGYCSAEGKAESWDAGYHLMNDGYYDSEGKYVFSNLNGGKWQPWNPVVTTVVRRIVNPIPMYAKRVETELPSADQPVGYDLVAGDWVAPFGKGNKNDLILAIVDKRVVSFTDFDASLLITFSNARDGVQKAAKPNPFKGSTFAWTYASPEETYDICSNRMEIGYAPGKPFYRRNDGSVDGCYFRIRCVTNETGKIVSAYYGKMPGFIVFDPRGSKTASIQFTYYLNPTPNDRNIEFDPKRNLLHNLESTERVNMP